MVNAATKNNDVANTLAITDILNVSNEISQRLKSSFSLILTPGCLKLFSNLGACFSKSPLKRQFTKTVLIGSSNFLLILIGQ